MGQGCHPAGQCGGGGDERVVGQAAEGIAAVYDEDCGNIGGDGVLNLGELGCRAQARGGDVGAYRP